jgi:hypothetical protein
MMLGFFAGLLVGIVPLIIGLKKDNVGLGMGGFLVSALAGALLGVLPALPLAGVCTWVAVRKPYGSPAIVAPTRA